MSKCKKVKISAGESLSFYDLLDQKTIPQVIRELTALQERYKGREVYFYAEGFKLYLYETRDETTDECIAQTEQEKIKREIDKQEKADFDAKELRKFRNY